MSETPRERLIIDNFAGIKHLEIELKKINILIGPQATGKSVCAKLLYFLKSLFTDLPFFMLMSGKEYGWVQAVLMHFERCFPRRILHLTAPASVQYRIGDEWARIDVPASESEAAKFECSQVLSSVLYEIASSIVLNPANVSPEEWRRLPHVAMLQLIKKAAHRVSPLLAFDQSFVAAGRSIHSLLERQTLVLLSQKAIVDPFTLAFGAQYSAYKQLYFNPLQLGLRWKTAASDEMRQIIGQILRGNLEQTNGEERIDCPDGRQVDMLHASSAQQEVAPLLIFLAVAPFAGVDRLGNCLYVEEPEAHLYPTAQRDVVRLMATAFNAAMGRVQYVITTHSPYVLTSFNNLIEAGNLRKKFKGDNVRLAEISKSVPTSHALDIDDFSAYALDADSNARSIIDPEAHLLVAEEIDKVGEEIGVKFDELLDLGAV